MIEVVNVIYSKIPVNSIDSIKSIKHASAQIGTEHGRPEADYEGNRHERLQAYEG